MEQGIDTTGMPPPPNYRYREGEREIYTEKKLGDEMLALWETTELPADVAINQVRLVAYRGDKAVVARIGAVSRLPEGAPNPGESLEDAVRRIGREQAGIEEMSFRPIGHYRCKATSQSKTQAAGEISYEVLVGCEVDSFGDFPSDPAYERRTMLQRDFNVVIRSLYIERRQEFMDALDRYLIDRLRAKAPQV